MTTAEKVHQVLRDNKLTTISTIGNNKPESALIAFVENNKLELYFQTSKKTRKYQNLLANESVAFVIGFGWVNIQYEGIAKILVNENDIDNVKHLFELKESPTTRYYLELPDAVIFKVSPRWIGYRNYESHPPEILELQF